jgi:hypothetical protein
VNRVGEEAGFHYIGLSSAADYHGNILHRAAEDAEELFTFQIDPAGARRKHVIHCHGVYEIDRVNWRRPELYGPLVENPGQFRGHMNREMPRES